MPLGGWFTKVDVINDLSTATGKRAQDFGEEFVIVGEGPPPVQRMLEEEELQCLRLYGGDQSNIENNFNQPDLTGITEMIRMVDKFNNTTTPPVTPEKFKETSKKDNIVLSISKLNPNVPEFIPRSNISDINDKGAQKEIHKPNVIPKIVVDKEEVSNVSVIKNGENEINKTAICDTKSDNLTNARLDISSLTREQRKDMEVQLTTKINNTPNTSCFKAIRERNLAIATLVRLHCRSQNCEEKPKKLMTPDYFKTSPKVEMNTEEHTDNVECIDNSVVITKDVEESIKKVEDWLNPPTKNDSIPTKVPNKKINLGKITFKRKVSKPVSLASTVSETKVVSRGEAFVPSTFASQLSKKYEEKSKAKERSIECIWSKLETELKAKDEIIKKQKLQLSPEK